MLLIVGGGGLIIGIGIGLGISIFLAKRNNSEDGGFIQKLSEQFLMLAKEKLGSEKEEIKSDLNNKKEMIGTLVEEIRKELKRTDEHLRVSESERVASYSELKKEVQNYGQIASDLRTSTEELKRVLSNNQLRGQFGERIAEDLLKMAGFVVNQDYVANHANDTNQNRPDYTVYLPDRTKINIDVKFPYQALQKYVETENKDDKVRHFTQFARDVKEKVKQVCSRDYINPEENTVDFAMLFVPNEMIFSFIYEKMPEVWEEAIGKKVILAGPFSFTATLRLIKQAHSNFKLQGNIHNIVGLIQKFRQEFVKFNDEFDKVGQKIEAAAKQFQDVSSTRTRQLTRVVDQIDNENALAEPEEPKLIE